MNLPEGAARPLFVEKDPIIKDKAVESVKKCLETKKNPLGQFTKKLTTSDVKKIINDIKSEAKPAKPIPDGKYNVVLADPPWRYDFSVSDSRKIENQYPTMELDKICALSKEIPFADDCILFLWGTAPKLKESLTVIESWGFEYKTHAIWGRVSRSLNRYSEHIVQIT